MVSRNIPDARTNSETAEQVPPMVKVAASKELHSSERALLAKFNEKFLQNELFRKVASKYLDLLLHGRPEDVFPLMDLPTELRVMICEYALTFDRGIAWRWTKSPTGSRIAIFTENDSVEAILGDVVPIEGLYLCRQLHQENKSLLLKVNELYFDGGKDEESDSDGSGSDSDDSGVDNSNHLDRAINDLSFFLSRTNATVIANAAVCINSRRINLYPKPLLRLFQLAKDTPALKIRVIDSSWGPGRTSKKAARRFMQDGADLEMFLNKKIFSGLERKWRVFPAHLESDELEALSTHLSSEDRETALEYIKYGV